MIIVDNVVAGYRTPRGLVKAIDRVSLEVRDGEILGIAGESGCGKTTLLKLLYGNFSDGLEILSGRITWRDRDGRRSIDSADFHKHWWEIFSYVPQGSMSALNPLMRIAPQMLDAGTGMARPDMAKRRTRIVQTLAELDLAERTLRLHPHQLSGGMRQRVLIGLASYIDPDIVLADEPTTALDVVVQRQILESLVRLQRARRNSIVIVSHDLGLHAQVAGRVPPIPSCANRRIPTRAAWSTRCRGWVTSSRASASRAARPTLPTCRRAVGSGRAAAAPSIPVLWPIPIRFRRPRQIGQRPAFVSKTLSPDGSASDPRGA